jgi:hypothetical protein
MLGVLAGLLGFAMIWYIWWMAIASGLCMWAVIIARVYDDDAEYCLPASEVEEIEARRYQALASPPARRRRERRPSPINRCRKA